MQGVVSRAACRDAVSHGVQSTSAATGAGGAEAEMQCSSMCIMHRMCSSLTTLGQAPALPLGTPTGKIAAGDVALSEVVATQSAIFGKASGGWLAVMCPTPTPAPTTSFRTHHYCMCHTSFRTPSSGVVADRIVNGFNDLPADNNFEDPPAPNQVDPDGGVGSGDA